MDDQKFEYLIDELDDEIESTKVYSYKDFRRVVTKLELHITKAETIELKNFFNECAKERKAKHKKKYKRLSR